MATYMKLAALLFLLFGSLLGFVGAASVNSAEVSARTCSYRSQCAAELAAGGGTKAASAAAGTSILHYVGDVSNVLEGLVPENVRNVRVQADSLFVAFLGGSPFTLDSLGEMVTVNGVAYARSSDASSPDYYQLVQGTSFVTTGCLIIPKDTPPNLHWRKDPQSTSSDTSSDAAVGDTSDDAGLTRPPMLWDDFCLEAVQRADTAVAYAGFVEFESLRGTAASRPPIHGDHIFSHLDKYFTEPAVHLSQRKGFVVGCAASFQDLAPELRQQVSRFLYDGSNGPTGQDTGVGIKHHSHVLLLREGDRGRAISKPEDIAPQDVEGVYHLTGQSRVSDFDMDLWRIGGLRAHVEEQEQEKEGTD